MVGNLAQVECAPKGPRVKIGGGEQADVFLYLDGPFRGQVGRIPNGYEFQVPSTEKSLLHRFRAHQIAFLLFPEFNIRPTELDLNDSEMRSDYVSRSPENVLASTEVGIGRRHDPGRNESLPRAALEAGDKMNRAGVYVHNGLPNVSVTPERIIFFEVVAIDGAAVRRYLKECEMPEAKKDFIMTFLRAYELEDHLNDEAVEELIDDPRLRLAILREHDCLDLAPLYQAEIGTMIIPCRPAYQRSAS